MSSLSSVRTQLLSVFADASITAITDKVYNYDATARADEAEYFSSLIHYNQAINFYQWWVNRLEQPLALGATHYTYIFKTEYFLEVDKSGAAFNNAQDRIILVQDALSSVLGNNWGATVDGSNRVSDNIDRPDILELDNKKVWRTTITFTAFKQV